MSVRGLMPQTLQVPLAAGLAQKEDPRALQPPGLSRLVDGQFDEIGGIQLRKPYGTFGTFPSQQTTCRRVVANGDELLVFTKDKLYSYNASLGEYVEKGDHLAVKVEETSRFVTTADQYDADRAELGGVVFFSWSEDIDNSTRSFVAAFDASTGSTIMAPRRVTGAHKIRLTALESRVLLTFYDGVSDLWAYSLDPENPSAGVIAPPTVVFLGGGGGASSYYDVCRVPGADYAVLAIRRQPTTDYEVARVDANLGVLRDTKGPTSDLGIAIACDPTGEFAMIVRANGTDIMADMIYTEDLADVHVDMTIGTTTVIPSRVTAAFSAVKDGVGDFRCHAFWLDETTDEIKTNWVSTGGAIGVQSVHKVGLEIASRAFGHDGRVYLWTAFRTDSSFFSGASIYGYALQYTYFLFRDDGYLVAKASASRAGPNVTGYIPSVQSLGGGSFAWAGIYRNVIPIGGAATRTKYGAGTPRDIVFTFDSDEARRCVRLGQTLYITGGELKQYDGQRLTEVGFHLYPYLLAGTLSVGAGALVDGDYAYRQTWGWQNATGERERSASATTGIVTVASGPKNVTIQWGTLVPTHKQDIAAEVWRTTINPTIDVPFHLVTSNNPNDAANPNRYLLNKPNALAGDNLTDGYSDSGLNELEMLQEAVLESISPPAATIIAASADRLFLAGIAGEPSTIWYSRSRGDGEVASFHEALRVSLPTGAGPITALGVLSETLVAFTATSVYVLPGDGFDNVGGGINYGPARVVSSDVGALSAESVALIPQGLIFKSRKGWYLLNRGWAVEYIGGGVSDYDAETVHAVNVVESQHQVRALTSGRMLVFDYLVGQWAEWSVSDGVHACLWQSKHLYLTASRVRQQLDAFNASTTYGLDVETAWIPLGSPGWGRVWKVVVLGEYRSSHELRVRLARDYSDVYFQDKLWSPSPTTVGGPLQIKHGPSIQELQAIKVRLTVTSAAGESLKLTNLSLEVGLERGLRPLRAAQQQ